MAELFTTVLTFGRYLVQIGTDGPTGKQRLTIQLIENIAANPVDAPVLTQTSALHANPLTWNSVYNNSLIYDGAGNGDKIRMRFRLNGGAWTTETDVPLDATILLSGTYTWPLYNATTYPVGGLVEVQEQKGRFVAGVETQTSDWGLLSDNINVAAFALSDLFGAGDVGNAWNPTDLNHVWTSNAGTGAGAFASLVGRLDDISGKGKHWNSVADDNTRPTLVNTNNGLLSLAGAQKLISTASGLYAAGAMTWIAAVKSSDASAPFIWAETRSVTSINPVYAPGLRGSGAGGNVLNFQRNDANSAIANSIAAAVLDGSIHIVVVKDTGTVVSVSIDGAAFVTNSYVRNSPLTLDRTCLGDAYGVASDFAQFTGNIGAGLAIGRVLTGTLGTAGTEMTKAYNKIAAYHGLTQL